MSSLVVLLVVGLSRVRSNPGLLVDWENTRTEGPGSDDEGCVVHLGVGVGTGTTEGKVHRNGKPQVVPGLQEVRYTSEVRRDSPREGEGRRGVPIKLD